MFQTTTAMDSRSRTSRWFVSADQLFLLSQALKIAGAGDGASQAQRMFIRELCSSPHVRTLAPEQFVISMKQMLNAAANDARLPLGRQRDDLIFHLLSVSIEEFFQDGNGNGNGNSDGDGLSTKDSVRRASSRPRTVGSARKPPDDQCRGSR